MCSPDFVLNAYSYIILLIFAVAVVSSIIALICSFVEMLVLKWEYRRAEHARQQARENFFRTHGY